MIDLSLSLNNNKNNSPNFPVLDRFGGAALAMGVYKLRSSYTGSCMRVRRSSDNVEADIGFSSSGWLDETALLAHVGANDGFVVTLYDQANSLNATQATAAAQPKIVTAGVVEKFNSRPTIVFSGAQILTISGYNTSPGTVNCVHMPTSTNGLLNRLLIKQDSGTGQEWAMRWGNTTQAHFYRLTGGNVLVAYTFQTTQLEVWTGRSTSNLRRNGTSIGSAAAFPTTPSTGTLKIGGDSAASNNHTGRINEIIIWPTVLTDSEVQVIERAQGYRFGFTVA